MTADFPFGFLLFYPDDLEVSLDGVVQTSGFTVSGLGVIAGGSVTFSSVPANGVKVLLASKPIIERDTDYPQFGDLPSQTVNQDFDRLWVAIRSLYQTIKSAIKLPFDTADEPIINADAAARASKYIGFDASGDLAITDIPDLADTQAAAAAAQAAAGAIVGLENMHAWVTATVYAVNNLVQNSGNTYICLIAHTSGTLSTDIAAGKWEILAAKGSAGAGTGDMLAANNLSDLVNKPTSRTNLGLGDAATKTVGTSAGNVPAVGTASATVTVAGLSRLATQAEAEAGAENTAAMTALRVKQAIAVSSGGVFTKDSGELESGALSPGALLTLAHGLAAVPKLVQVFYKCITANAGYSVGDMAMTPVGVTGFDGGIGVWWDGTNVYVRCNSSAPVIVLNKTNGVIVSGTTARWHVVARAFA